MNKCNVSITTTVNEGDIDIKKPLLNEERGRYLIYLSSGERINNFLYTDNIEFEDSLCSYK